MKSEVLGATDTSNRRSYMCPVFIPNLLTLYNLQPFATNVPGVLFSALYSTVIPQRTLQGLPCY